MRPEPDDRIDADVEGDDPESVDLVARARAAVIEMRRQAEAGGLDETPGDAGPGEDFPAPKRRRKKGAGRAA